MASLNDIKVAELTAESSVESRTTETQGVLSSLDTTNGEKAQGASVHTGGPWVFGSTTTWDFVGINTNGLTEMCDAVDQYCNKVKTKLDEFESQANTEGHFAGDYAAAITEFMISVKSSCIAQVDALLAFKKDLQAVVSTMEAKDTAVAGGINAEASSIARASGDGEN